MAGKQQKAASIFDINLRFGKVALVGAILFATTLMAAPGAQAQSYQVLYNFNGQSDGGNSSVGLTMDQRGNLYGVADYFGNGHCSFGGSVGCGTAFELQRKGSTWIFNLLHTFQGGLDGQTPTGRIVFGPKGSLYGTTAFGGGGNCVFGQGCGTVFNLQPPASVCKSAMCPWRETVLYRFAGGSDGMWPQLGDLAFDQAGNIYGTTPPTVYELVHSNGGWNFNLLYTLDGGDDGYGSFSGVIFDPAGNMYGSAYSGGANGGGTVFEMSPSGGGWTYVLHSFRFNADGASPQGNLIFDPQGNLYGTTPEGGPYNAGTAYELTPSSGDFTVLRSFTGIEDEGPTDALAFDAAGNLYGTTYGGGRNNRGNVFKLTPYPGGWTYTNLHDFAGGADGSTPAGKLIVDANGNLYGTTAYGGSGNCNQGCGVIYQITP